MFEVSIIIPVYNVEDYVAECLHSVMKQEATCSMECLVIDDCGSDSSMDIVREVIAAYSGPISFRIIEHEQNGGLSAARNSGIRAAKGKYVYFLDSDDLITPDCIGTLFQRVCEHPGVQIVTGDFQTFPEPDVHKLISLQGKNFPEYSDDIAWIRSIFLTKFPITAWNKLILKNFITDNNLYFKEGVLHEDNHWHAVAYHYIRSVAFADHVTYLYRMREGSITQSKGSLERQIQNFNIIFKDILTRNVTWDKMWDKWLFNQICDYKYSAYWDSVRPDAEKTWKTIAWGAFKNASCPLFLRLMYLYMLFPRKIRWNRLVFGFHYRYNKRLPICSEPLR